MPVLTPTDASILALLAQHPKAPASKRRGLFKLLGSEAKQVARALTGKGARAVTPAEATANGLIRWADGNAKPEFKMASKKVKNDFANTYRVVVSDKQASNTILGHDLPTQRRTAKRKVTAKKSR